MTDVVLVDRNNIVAQLWPDATKAQLNFNAELMAMMYEVASGAVAEGDLYDPATKIFSKPAPLPVIVSYAAFRARWQTAEMQALHAARLDPANWQIDDMIGIAQAQNAVNLSSDLAATAKALLVAASVLTADRADIVFATS